MLHLRHQPLNTRVPDVAEKQISAAMRDRKERIFGFRGITPVSFTDSEGSVPSDDL